MKVLVSGATGFVGQHVVPALLDRGHDVTALARNEDKAKGFDWYPRVQFQAHDILDTTASIPPELGQNDAVIHLAWSDLPNYRALFHFERNLPADYRFLKALVEAGVKQVLVSGTCFEYGMQSGCLSEDMPTRPANSYALAKDTLRRFLEQLREQQPFVLQWARLFYIHGQGQNPKSLLAQLDRAIDAGEASFAMSGGEQLRDYLSVDEVARCLVAILEHPGCAGAVNVCSGEPISIRHLVEQRVAQRGAHVRLGLGQLPYPEHEPMEFWGDRRKMDQLLKVSVDGPNQPLRAESYLESSNPSWGRNI